MACGCGKKSSGNANVNYEVRFKGGGTETFSSVSAAQQAIRTKGGGTIKAIRA